MFDNLHKWSESLPSCPNPDFGLQVAWNTCNSDLTLEGDEWGKPLLTDQ